MLAATSTENKLDIKQVDRPTATKNSIVIKNSIVGVNYIDALHIRGIFPTHTSKVIGTEGAGTVVEVGEGITDYKVGDRVISIEGGSHAEYSIAYETAFKTYKIPDNVSFETAAAFGVQGLTALALVEGTTDIQKGDFVLVHAAAGGVGGFLVQLLHQKGAIVIGTTSTDEKADFVKTLGADHVINYKRESIFERVKEITNGEGVRVSLDGVGGTGFEESSIKTLGLKGTVISFGFAAGPVPPLDVANLFIRNNKVQGTSLWNHLTTKEESNKWWSRLFQLIHQDKLKATVSETYFFDHLGEAVDDILSGKTKGKLLVQL